MRPGDPLFYDLVRSSRKPAYVALDLFWLNGADLHSLSLSECRRRLHRLLPKGSPVISEALSVQGRGHEFFNNLAARLRCRECDEKAKAVVSIKWSVGRAPGPPTGHPRNHAALTPRLNPHRAHGTDGAPTSRDFVPWRLFRRRPPERVEGLSLPASENLHTSGHQLTRPR